ncbi:MAG TPA: hypothetical protein VMS98_20430 [Thermoanaerobaculia bacterium]|nr:hypothetical protein [Thermoanaerobaculia bacterium]
MKVLAACILVLLVGAASVDASCKPVVGHFEATLVFPGQGHCPSDPSAFCTSGRVWGGIQGNYQFVMTGSVSSATLGGPASVLFFTGRSVVFLKNGSQITGTDTGSIDLPMIGGQGGFASLITFGPRSQIRLRGEFDPDAATTSGDYIGSMCSE